MYVGHTALDRGPGPLSSALRPTFGFMCGFGEKSIVECRKTSDFNRDDNLISTVNRKGFAMM